MKNWIATVFFAAGLLGLATQLSARPGSGMEHMDPLDHIERMAEHLELSAAQDQEITRLIEEAHLATAVDRERLQQIREDLRALKSGFDEGVAQTLADELGQISGRLAYSHVSTIAAVRSVLSAEQLQQLEEHRERLAEFRERRSELRNQLGDNRRDMRRNQ